MQMEYDVIFLGCSCFAMGCAARHPSRTLILESGEGLGGEFVDALFAGKAPIERPEGPGAAFYDELEARGIFSAESAARGAVHVPAIHMVLARLALAHGLNIRFHTRVLAQERAGQGIAVQTVCNARMETFHCKKVVDTRSDLAAVRAWDAGAICQLRANLYAPAECACGGWGDLTLHPGFLPEEAFLAMPVAADHPPAAEALLCAFEQRPAQALPLRLLTLAHAHAILCRAIRAQTPTGWFIPGCGFDNPVQAWAAGLAETEVFA